MDEAGYGPNFGPLVVAATAWRVENREKGTGNREHDGEFALANGPSATAIAARTKRRAAHDCVDLYRLLRNVVAKSASERRIAIADSKALYNPSVGLRQLERGVHAVLLSMRHTASCWNSIVRCCQADPDGHHNRFCWPDGYDCALPLNAVADELARLAARFTRACDATGVRPLAIRARLVFPAEFNDLVEYHGSKGAALSHLTVGLLREVVDVLQGNMLEKLDASSLTSDLRPPTSIYAVCDKHGGRNYYTALLQHHFSEHWIEPVAESRFESRYEWGASESRVRVNFRMHGETFLPTALASMTAKYLRELAMRAFNEFWRAHVPDLRPTAGYPSDSHRFRKVIAAAQRKLNIDDHVLWRKR